MKSSAAIFLLLVTTASLSGCAKGPNLLDLTLKPRTVTVVTCPQLAPPPEATVDALEADAKVHPETGKWAVALEKHLTKLETCVPSS